MVNLFTHQKLAGCSIWQFISRQHQLRRLWRAAKRQALSKGHPYVENDASSGISEEGTYLNTVISFKNFDDYESQIMGEDSYLVSLLNPPKEAEAA